MTLCRIGQRTYSQTGMREPPNLAASAAKFSRLWEAAQHHPCAHLQGIPGGIVLHVAQRNPIPKVTRYIFLLTCLN